MEYKTCARCDETLPVTCFWKDKARKDGCRPYCKACQADVHQEWRVRTGRTKRTYNPLGKWCNDQ